MNIGILDMDGQMNFKKGVKMKEFDKLRSLLLKNKIPFEERIINTYYHGGYPQIIYPDDNNRVCDVIALPEQKGKLEMMGLVDVELLGDNVQAYMTANEVFEKILNHFNGEEN